MVRLSPGVDVNFLFDLDGTILDSAAGIKWSVLKTFEELQYDLPDSYDIPIGPPILNTIKKLLGPSADRDFETARVTYQRLYAEHGATMFSLYPDIEAVLSKLRANGHALFIVTSKAEPFAQQMIRSLKWNFFKGIYGSGLKGEFLDKSELVGHVRIKENLAIDSTVMVGDRHHDIVAANQNSIRSIGVLWGYGSEDELKGCSPTRIIGKPIELLDF